MTDTLNTWWLWISTEELKVELKQLIEEGRDTSSLLETFELLIMLGNEKLALPENQVRAQELLDAAQQLPRHGDYGFDEPSELGAIRKLRPRGPRRFKTPLGDKAIRDRIHGAWLGRCIGCLLGKPVEGVRSWDIEGFLKASGQWPLSDYIRFGVRGKAKTQFPDLAAKAAYDKMDYMPIDDDTNYTTLGHILLKQRGAQFTPVDVAHAWMQMLPLEATCTAERVAYRNFAMNIAPPQSASFRNPFREWIGAQIRADAFGYVNAGNPERAAEFAWRDASISHVKNGIYGEMFVAAMIAAAPWCESIGELLCAGLSEIPKTSRLYADVSAALLWHKDKLTFEQALERIHERWNEDFSHDWCHTNSNAVICAVALLWGEGNFGDSICKAVMAGYDTDCNGATVGSILGMMHGVQGIGESWQAKLNNTLKTSMAGYESVEVDKIARETFEVWKKLKDAK